VESSILKLYPQFDESKDRRQEGFAVGFERRSGDDRRQGQRLSDPKLGQDITSVQDTFKAFIRKDEQNPAKNDGEKTKKFLAALSPIIPVRRLSSLPDNIEDHNYVRAAGLVALTGIMLPEDTRDLKDGLKQLLTNILPRKLRAGIAKNNRNMYKDFVWFNPKYDYKNYQAPFSFFRGTVLEPIVNRMGKLGVFLHKIDKPLYHTKFGKNIRDLFNISISDIESTGRKIPKVKIDKLGKAKIEKVFVDAYKFKGKTTSKLIGKALLRIPVISIFALGLLELPSILKSFGNDEDVKKKTINGFYQILKSSINVTSILSGIGIAGALLAKKGPAGSLLGMGVGSVVGAYASNRISNGLDTLKNKYQI
jgi:hypothetical protein